MTNQEILRVAIGQSAIDLCAAPEDFLTGGVAVVSRAVPEARRYLSLPFSLQMVSYGHGIVASASPALLGVAEDYIKKYPAAHAFVTPHIYALNDALLPYGQRVCFMAEYFLPDLNELKPLPCRYEMRTLEKGDFEELYLPTWSNALCEKRRELDMLCVGAYDEGRLIALAGASADCETMWQIGIDVLPSYRRQGIASALTSALTLSIIERGRVPFYCAAWCNLASVKNALRSGFRPAWTEITAKSIEKTEKANQV